VVGDTGFEPVTSRM